MGLTDRNGQSLHITPAPWLAFAKRAQVSAKLISTNLGVLLSMLMTKENFPLPKKAYPPLLAYTMAYAIAQQLIHQGWQPPPAELAPPDTLSYHYLRAIVGSQPKASKLPPMLSEFAKVVRVPVS